MKFVSIIIISLLGYSMGYGQSSIHFSQSTIDYGLIEKNSNPFRSIMVSNKGKDPLKIFNCEAGCGCMAAICPKDSILLGQSDTLMLRYNTGLVGKFAKRVFIYSNDPKMPKSEIIIKGEVKNNFSINQEKTPLQMVPKL